ncbi:hypothetical protein CC1G_07982 [Coprinopsis cinerea okayama7|uniref:S-adenosyl-L-methionine-dependent methyltransferase n=1 Tax=Coprinopsis cinerea (strain Okayama-7 / 130 / ATCC MYA-4618 / FGSC 9003) TaxID=240176 RepID=A8P244_COPC7|nr:hypothetical protein CC1G_07982 [Coprinopsis cinerea okayama7\|eukprot:XP_001838241.1 hypothetical protein CC1G_07982 [Coprinopsis cinerea okayama7\
MKLSNAFSLLWDLLAAGRIALLPTLKDVLRSPSLIFRPQALSRTFMAYVWANGFGNDTDAGGRPVKEHLITPNAYGVVLDLGAGHGHTVRYLDRERVTKYVALEPNVLMHPKIRESAHAASFHESDGTLVILSCGAEDATEILTKLSGSPVNTIISVLTICSIPNPEKTIHDLVRDVLAPGGQLLFYEHVLSHRPDVAWWQQFWTPIWQRGFDGCKLDRPSHLYVRDLKIAYGQEEEEPWKEGELWGKPEEPEEHLFWHQVGRFVKK